MLLYRSASYAELQDILGRLNSDPVRRLSQGKWFAESPSDATRWGRRLSLLMSGGSFHLIEVEVDDGITAGWFRLLLLDQIGPARYADIPDLPAVRFVREVVPIPTSPP